MLCPEINHSENAKGIQQFAVIACMLHKAKAWEQTEYTLDNHHLYLTFLFQHYGEWGDNNE